MRPLLALGLSLCTACASVSSQADRATIISPGASGEARAWSDAERAAPVVLRNLQRTPEASYHLLRVRTALPRRQHERADLVLMVVAGHPKLTLGSDAVSAQPGTVVEIPRGTAYAVENAGAEPAVLYGVATPALDPEDSRQVPEGETVSAWRWNLWPQ